MERLRIVLGRRLIDTLVNNCTHDSLAEKARELGLVDSDKGSSKREKITARFDAVPDAELGTVAEKYLAWLQVKGADRNQIQDLVWASQGYPEISKRIRREFARALNVPLFLDSTAFMHLLDQLWVLGADYSNSFFGESGQPSLRTRVEKHLICNDDWTAEDLFTEIGAYQASDRRFALFVEGLASAEVLPDVAAQRRFVGLANPALRPASVELRETGERDGYPVFHVVALNRAPVGRPKNLIFASAIKPDLRLRSAVDNDVEVMTGADKVLIYDRPIDEGGVKWNDLQAWWGETTGRTNVEDAKKTLYQRLLQCLPKNSPPQRWFFEAYHYEFSRDIPGLPALIPEVWLHWDHKTVQERGADALFRFRMDFLMLLPNRVRVVVEIDGRQHYADAAGIANPAAYARMAGADRELKLVGYEVYRFGAAELPDAARAAHVVREFYQGLFDRHQVKYS